MEKQLIEFVRENPFFYDKKHVSYRNQLVKDEKWMEFSEDSGVPIDALKKRWKSLRDRYFRICKSGTHAKTGYKYFKNLQFLSGHEPQNSKHKSHNSSIINYDDETQDILSKSEDSLLLDEASLFSCYEENETVSISPVTTSKKRKLYDAQEKDVLSESGKMPGGQSSTTTPFRAFLESVALTVESANFDMNKIMRLQMNILQLVHSELQKETDDNYYA